MTRMPTSQVPYLPDDQEDARVVYAGTPAALPRERSTLKHGPFVPGLARHSVAVEQHILYLDELNCPEG